MGRKIRIFSLGLKNNILIKKKECMPLKCGLKCGHQAYLSDMVEAVQRRGTKLVVGNRISYKERLNKD